MQKKYIAPTAAVASVSIQLLQQPSQVPVDLNETGYQAEAEGRCWRKGLWDDDEWDEEEEE